MSSGVGDILAQLGALRESLPYARATEFDDALDGVAVQVQAVLGTSRNSDLVNQIHAVCAEGSEAIQEHLDQINTLIDNTATQL